MSRTAVSYRGEHVDPGNDVPVLVPGVVHEIDRVAHVVRPEKKQKKKKWEVTKQTVKQQ